MALYKYFAIKQTRLVTETVTDSGQRSLLGTSLERTPLTSRNNQEQQAATTTRNNNNELHKVHSHRQELLQLQPLPREGKVKKRKVDDDDDASGKQPLKQKQK